MDMVRLRRDMVRLRRDMVSEVEPSLLDKIRAIF